MCRDTTIFPGHVDILFAIHTDAMRMIYSQS